MELSEFLMKMIQIGAVTLAMVAIILASAHFSGQIHAFAETKVSIDFAHALTMDPCVVQEVNGEVRKGLLMADKLDDVDDDNEICFEVNAEYYITVYAINGESWKIGTDFKEGETSEVPVVINYGDEVVPGIAYVKVKI